MIFLNASIADAGVAVQHFYKIVTKVPIVNIQIGEKCSLSQHQYTNFCFKLDVQLYIFVITSENEQ
jgi:hypothetical protein